MNDFTLNHERLRYMRECQIVVELGSDPNAPCLDAAMATLHREKIRLAGATKIKLQIFQQLALIAFDHELEVSFPSDDVVRQLYLCEQRVRADGFVFDIDRVQQGRSDFNLIGLFELVGAGYRQLTDFFWV